MTTELIWQQGKANLAAAIAAGDTSCTFIITAASQAPPSLSAGQQFRFTIENEVVTATAISGPVASVYTATITRTQSGSTNAAHPINALIYGVATTEGVQGLINQTVPAGVLATSVAAPTFSATGNTAIASAASAATLAGSVTGTVGAAVLTPADNTVPVGATGNRYTSVYASTSHVVYVSSTDSATLSHSALTFAPGTAAPGIIQSTQTGDNACPNLTLTPSAPYASASSNVVGGSLIVALAQPISGTTESYFQVNRGGNLVCRIASWSNNATQAGIWLIPNTAPTTGNHSVQANSAQTSINAPTGGTVALGTNGSSYFQVSSTIVSIFTNTLQWPNYSTPVINQVAPAAVSSGNGTAGTAMAITAQTGGAASTNSGVGGVGAALTVSSGTGGAESGTTSTGGQGGALNLNGAGGGTGTSTNGAPGSVNVQLVGVSYAGMTQYGWYDTPYAWSMGITTGTATLTAAQYIYPAVSVATVSLSGALAIVFPSNAGSIWTLDVSKVTFGAYAITVKCGSGAASTTITSSSVKTLWTVFCPAANVCVIG